MTQTAYGRNSSTGTGRNLAFQTWAKTIEVPAYEKMIMIPTLDELGRPYGTQNIRYWDQLTAQQLTAAGGSTTALDIVGITVNSGTPTVLTYTSTFVYTAVVINDDTAQTVEVDLDPGMRDNTEQCVADACDGVICALASSLTDGLGDGTTSANMLDIRKLVARARITSPKVMVGERTIHATLHPGALDGLANAADWMNAQVRGDEENPQVRGIFMKAYGILFHFTTKTPTANGNGGEGSIYVPETYAVGWNQRPRVEVQRSGVSNYVIASANLGGRVKWDSRGKYYRTVTTV